MGRNQKTFVEHVVSGIAFVPGADSMGKRTAEEFTDGTLQTQADRRLVLTFRYFRQMGPADWKDVFGQQQRVAFVRALCQPFDFIFLDEPVSHLDDGNGKIMADILHEEAEKQGAGIIVTSIGKHIPLNYDRVLSL